MVSLLVKYYPEILVDTSTDFGNSLILPSLPVWTHEFTSPSLVPWWSFVYQLFNWKYLVVNSWTWPEFWQVEFLYCTHCQKSNAWFESDGKCIRHLCLQISNIYTAHYLQNFMRRHVCSVPHVEFGTTMYQQYTL